MTMSNLMTDLPDSFTVIEEASKLSESVSPGNKPKGTDEMWACVSKRCLYIHARG